MGFFSEVTGHILNKLVAFVSHEKARLEHFILAQQMELGHYNLRNISMPKTKEHTEVILLHQKEYFSNVGPFSKL